MSLLVTAMVWRARLPSTQKLVALRLADFAWDDGGRIFPGNARVARECGLTVRAVRDALRALESAGLLVLMAQERPGQHMPREYRFSLDALAALAVPDVTEDGPGMSDVPRKQAPREELPSRRNLLPPAPLYQGEGGSSLSSPAGGTTFLPPPPSRRNHVPHQEEPRSSNPLLDPLRDRGRDAGARGDVTDDAAVTAATSHSASANDEPNGFAEWYAAYPRKRDPGQARRAYRTALRKTSPAVLLMAARAYADECYRTGRDPKFIKHPSTWLNAEAWANAPEPNNGADHARHARSAAPEPRGAAAVEQLLSRLGDGVGDPDSGRGDRRRIHGEDWDLDLSAMLTGSDPAGGE